MFRNDMLKNEKKRLNLIEHRAEYKEVQKMLEKEADRVVNREIFLNHII